MREKRRKRKRASEADVDDVQLGREMCFHALTVSRERKEARKREKAS